jgi:hypothetical protein
VQFRRKVKLNHAAAKRSARHRCSRVLGNGTPGLSSLSSACSIV